MSGSSYRAILRASSITGGAQVINIIAGLLKMKAAAVLVGPAGVGLVGLYLHLVQTGASIASLGISNVGTRQIAAAHAEGGETVVGRTRRALFWGTFALSVIGAALFWLSRGWISRAVLGDDDLSDDVGWLSLAVALSVAAGGQGALLTGLRRIGDLARVNVAAGLASAVLGVLALWVWERQGLVAMVLIGPFVTFLCGHVYVARLGPPAGSSSPFPAMVREWGSMARLGLAFMISGLVTMLGYLAVRALVQRQLGLEALGHYQAAWAIGTTYLGVVLGAMGTDFYPRLTATINDREAAVRLVNEQTEVALLLCAPVLLVMLGFAPWVIRLLYSAEFSPAVDVLHWHLIGDVLKLMSWPLGFLILASGDGRSFVVIESVGIGVFASAVFLALPLFGLNATGFAFVVLYTVYLPLVWWMGRRRIGFRWVRPVQLQATALTISSVVVVFASRWSEPWGAGVGGVLAASMGLWSLIRLSTLLDLSGWVGRFALLKKCRE